MSKKKKIYNKEIKLLNKEKKIKLIEDKSERLRILEDENIKLKNEVESLKSELEKFKELNDKYLRKIAEFENHKKILKKEYEKEFEDRMAGIMNEILDVIDNFDRAIDSLQKTEDKNSVIDGIVMIDKKFHQVLEKIGIKKIESHGEPFDPAKHDAISIVSLPDIPDGRIVEVCQRGYFMGEKVLRPSKVIVNRREEENNND